MEILSEVGERGKEVALQPSLMQVAEPDRVYQHPSPLNRTFETRNVLSWVRA